MELSQLRNVTNIESLILNDAVITSDGLAHLRNLPLAELTLIKVKIKGEALKQLAALRHLRHFDLAGVTMDEASIAHFADMKNLVHLGMDFVINDEQMRHLGALKNLRRLTLGNSPITNKGLQHLNGLTNLRDLAIVNSRITEEGLRHLVDLKQLI